MSGWITGCLCTLSSGLVVTLSVLPGKLQLRQTDSEGPTLEEHKFIVKMFIQAGNNHDWGTWIFLSPRKASWNNVRCQERTRSNKSSLQLAEELEVCQWIYMDRWMDIDARRWVENLLLLEIGALPQVQFSSWTISFFHLVLLNAGWAADAGWWVMMEWSETLQQLHKHASCCYNSRVHNIIKW